MIPTGLILLSMMIAVAGGIVRGVTGFGGSLIMTPALTLMFPATAVVPVVLLLETFAAAPMLRPALRKAEFHIIVPICIGALITVPFGGHLLVSLDPVVLRRWVALTVIIFSMLLLANVRYSGPRNRLTSGLVGGLSGILLGGTGIGGPPVILFLLSGRGPVDIARANLTLIVSLISIMGLVMLWIRGVLTGQSLVHLAVLGPCFYVGTIVGIHLFRGTSEQRFRQIAPLLLISVSILALLR